MAQLYNVDSPINREQRNNINATFADIQLRLSNLRFQLSILAGGADLEEIINRIEQTITNANNTTANTQQVLDDISAALDTLQGRIQDSDAATQSAIDATNQVNQEVVNLQNRINQLGNARTYDSNTTYQLNNVVEYNGSSFIALQTTTGNNPPTLPERNNQYWQLLAQRGVDGTGSVSSVSGISPDVNGEVTLTYENVNAASKVQFDEYVNNGFANVKEFGAVGDGTTNDFAAIQSAIDSGREVYLPPGNYFIGENSLTGFKKITGSGKNVSTITFTGNVIALNSNLERINLNSFTIQNESRTGTGINITNGNYSIIDDLYIFGTGTAVSISNTQALKLNNSEIWGFSQYGIFLNGSNNDNFFSNCFINGQNPDSSAGPGIGIRMLDKAEAITFNSMEVILCNYALSTDAQVNGFNSRPAYSVFTNCYFDSSTNGVFLDKVVNMNFNQCWFSNRPSSGCVLNECDDVTFTSCNFVNNAQHGCVVQSLSKRVKFIGCSFLSNSSQQSGVFSGLVIAENTTDFIVKECTATNVNGFSNVQNNGIFVGPGTSDRYIISDNLVSGNGGSGVADNGIGTNKNVSNNY